MRALTFTVPKEWEQSKLKVFLRGYCNLSARLLTKQKRVKMGLTINGEHGRANDLLKTGDVVCVNLPDTKRILRLFRCRFLLCMRMTISS